MEEVNAKATNFKRFKFPSKTKPVLKDPRVLQDLEELHRKYVVVPIDKAANNVAFVYKKFYVEKLLTEIGIMGNPSDTYNVIERNIQSIIVNNVELCKKFGLSVDERDNKLPIMYWMPKMQKTPSGARFIVASSACSTKPLSKAMSFVFKLIFEQIQQFHLKSRFYSSIHKFWVVKNCKPVLEKLEVINTRKRAKCISAYDFSTLYTALPHDDLIRVLNEIVDFVFEGGNKQYIGFSSTKAFWLKKRKGKNYFSKSSLKRILKHLIVDSYFQVGNKLLVQSIGIPMGIDPAPFWANLYLYKYECAFVSELTHGHIQRARKFHGCSRFIDDMCCLNDGSEFGKSYKDIYPESLILKCEHQGTHATFLDIDITIADGIFVYKLFDKRDEFPFFIVRMPHISSNIPSYIFYGTVLSEFLRIARSTLLLADFLPRVNDLSKRMLSQGGDQGKIFRQFSKAVEKHPMPFKTFQITSRELIETVRLSVMG